MGSLRLHDERAQKAEHHLDRRVVVRVVHVRPGIGHREFIGIGLARLDRRLGDVRDTILVVGHLDAVKMDDGRFGQFILEDDTHPVALADPDLRPGHLPVVRPGFGFFSRLHLPLDLRRCQVEDLHSAFQPRLR